MSNPESFVYVNIASYVIMNSTNSVTENLLK